MDQVQIQPVTSKRDIMLNLAQELEDKADSLTPKTAAVAKGIASAFYYATGQIALEELLATHLSELLERQKKPAKSAAKPTGSAKKKVRRGLFKKK